mmetsp:Transcript_23416/g.37472  ORF Transcript_23416/g.37472 Transcript_23416/m.37472 type:complete len:483 (+) Transcript_23416:44-1492(+)
MTCNKGHPLAKTDLSQLIKENTGYLSGYSCDICQSSQKGASYHCPLCYYDLCGECFNTYEQVQPSLHSVKNASISCPGKHGLTIFYTPQQGYGCDICSKRFPANTTLYGCRTCNYDLCGDCYHGSSASADKPPPQPAFKPPPQQPYASKQAAAASSDPFQDFLSGKNRKPIVYTTTNMTTGAQGMIVDVHSGSLDIFRRGDRVQHKKTQKAGTMRMVSAGRHLVHWDNNTDTWEDKKDLQRAGSAANVNDGWNMANIENLKKKYETDVKDEKQNESVKAAYHAAYNQSKQLYDSCWSVALSDAQFDALNERAAQIANLKTIQKKPQQPIKDPVAIYKQAKETLPHLMAALQAIATASGGSLKKAPLKKIERSVEKVVGNYDHDWSKLTDIARASLIYESLSKMLVALEAIRKDEQTFTILRIKNRFDKSVNSAYRDCSMLVWLNKVGNKHVCEVQLHLKAYIDKKGAGGHMAYKGARSFDVQ